MTYDQAPELKVHEWLQGKPTTLNDLLGEPVVLHMFQVNCPGCFLYSIPKIYELEKKYVPKGVEFVGLAVRFEEFDENSKKNFKNFLNKGELTDLVRRKCSENLIRDYASRKIKLNYRVGWDKGSDGSYSETFGSYVQKNLVRGTPYEYLIDSKGQIVMRDFDLDIDVISGNLDNMLAK